MQKFKLQYADKVVVPFNGASFRSAERLLWLVSPLADHHSARDGPPAVHLNFILDHYSDRMSKHFEAIVSLQHALPKQVVILDA